jgi:hypothetical protein
MDKRKEGLKNGLRQLTDEQINRVLDWPHEMVLDEFNYQDGKYCPLAVGVNIPSIIKGEPSHEKVSAILTLLGYKIYNTRGIQGEFYTSDRFGDLRIAAYEILQERKEAKSKDERDAWLRDYVHPDSFGGSDF